MRLKRGRSLGCLPSRGPHQKMFDWDSVLRYKVVKQLGDGTYGTVWKAINRQSNEVVSFKDRKMWMTFRARLNKLLLACLNGAGRN